MSFQRHNDALRVMKLNRERATFPLLIRRCLAKVDIIFFSLPNSSYVYSYNIDTGRSSDELAACRDSRNLHLRRWVRH